MHSPFSTRIDLREVSPRERLALIFGRFDALAAGEALELVDDHDPLPLRDELDGRSPAGFAWGTVESGPDSWRVRIEKTQATAVPVTAGSCCSGGACCG